MKRAVFSLVVMAFLLSACGPNWFFNVDALKTVTPDAGPQEVVAGTPTPYFYEVKEGDTLWGISQKTGTDITTLIQVNEIKDPDRLRPGDRLLISHEVTISGTPLPTATPTPILCQYGCVEPPSGCKIKGYQARMDGERLYVLPDDDIYPLQQASVWFCREEDAIKLGWKHWTPRGPEQKHSP
jgi:LysM repeat protein